MNKIIQTSIVIILAIVSPFSSVDCQKMLLIERANSPKTVKFFEGDVLMFKTKEFPKEWQAKKIEDLLVDKKIILFSEGMVYLDDIIELRSFRGWAKAMSFILVRFGVAWWAMGGIVHFYDENFSFGWDTFIIGASSIVAGFLLKKLFHQKKYKLGNKWRLRMLDITMPTDPYGLRLNNQ